MRKRMNEGAFQPRRRDRPPRPRPALCTNRSPGLQVPLGATREWDRFLLHLGIPRTLKAPECVFESLRNSFSHFFICCLRCAFCSQRLQVSRIFIRNHATLTCPSVCCERNFPQGTTHSGNNPSERECFDGPK